MNSKALRWMVSAVAVLILALGISVRAQAPTPTHFSGLINDYSPETISGKVVGPWEMHGKWSLDLKGKSGLADFSAAMTMELSTMKDAKVSYPAPGVCPPYAPPAITNPGFMVTGPAYITGNGGPALFSKDDTVLSTLQVCVNGGSDVPYSNVTLVFGSPASGHFGTQAIHGVVREAKWFDQDDHHDGH
jgi:hypothetical protein